MKLNIYLISHPIIKILSNPYTINNNDIYTNQKKHLTLLLFYEIMRKNLNFKTIHIRQILSLKTIHLPDFHQRNCIITNLSDTYFLISEIQEIIPNLHIINIDTLSASYDANNRIKEILRCNQMTKNKVTIFETILIQNNILQLIEFLTSKLQISIKEVNIACLTCSNQVLKKISEKYPQLNIYTTNIMM